MYGKLYLIFNETDDGLALLKASLYPNSTLLSAIEEVEVDFHGVYVFLNYKYLLDVIKKEFSSYIESIVDEENFRNFTLEFYVPDTDENTKTYIKLVLNKINEHPAHLLKNIAYLQDGVRDDIFELYLHSAKTLISNIEWLTN
jgi:hypothetical protein